MEIERPLVANIVNSRKVMQVKVAIMTDYQYADQIAANIRKHEFAIRSEMLDVMRKIDEGSLEEACFRFDLRESLKASVNAVLERHDGFGVVTAVKFTDFIVM